VIEQLRAEIARLREAAAPLEPGTEARRELGEQALQLYTETKTVAIRLP